MIIMADSEKNVIIAKISGKLNFCSGIIPMDCSQYLNTIVVEKGKLVKKSIEDSSK